jgi:hypothetical protein
MRAFVGWRCIERLLLWGELMSSICEMLCLPTMSTGLASQFKFNHRIVKSPTI